MNDFNSDNRFDRTVALLPEEKAALNEYKIGSAYELNAFLRGYKTAASPDPLRYRQLDSAICKSRVLEPIHLYRATFAEDFDPFVRENVFHDPAYASTTLKESNLGRHFVSGFSSHPIKLVISCPKGAQAFYLELTDDNGETEGECLLPRCGRYRIDAELPPVRETKAIAKAMGQNNILHAKDFVTLRIIEVSLVIA